jgi:ribosomal protein S8
VGNALPVFYSNQKKRFRALLKEKGFQTHFQNAGHTLKRGPIRLQLDGIYPKNSDIVQFSVERSVRTSDHFPMWADILIK